MAVNKVNYGNETIIDITDTTASTDGVIAGQVFYGANGVRSVGTLDDVTSSTHGLMTAADKNKLDAFSAASAYALKEQILVQPTQPSSSDNKLWFNNSNTTEISIPTMSDLASVATSGSYSDLINAPTVYSHNLNLIEKIEFDYSEATETVRTMTPGGIDYDYDYMLIDCYFDPGVTFGNYGTIYFTKLNDESIARCELGAITTGTSWPQRCMMGALPVFGNKVIVFGTNPASPTGTPAGFRTGLYYPYSTNGFFPPIQKIKRLYISPLTGTGNIWIYGGNF